MHSILKLVHYFGLIHLPLEISGCSLFQAIPLGVILLGLPTLDDKVLADFPHKVALLSYLSVC